MKQSANGGGDGLIDGGDCGRTKSKVIGDGVDKIGIKDERSNNT